MRSFSYLLMKQRTSCYTNNWAGQIVYYAIKHDLPEDETRELVKREIEKGMKRLRNIGFHNRLQIDITAATLHFDVSLLDFTQVNGKWIYEGPDWKNIFKSRDRATIQRLIEDIDTHSGLVQIKRGTQRWNWLRKKFEMASPHVYLYVSFPQVGGFGGREKDEYQTIETFRRQVMILWRLVKLTDGTINPGYIRQKKQIINNTEHKSWLREAWEKIKTKWKILRN